MAGGMDESWACEGPVSNCPPVPGGLQRLLGGQRAPLQAGSSEVWEATRSKDGAASGLPLGEPTRTAPSVSIPTARQRGGSWRQQSSHCIPPYSSGTENPQN